jgi:hypothetical protein
MVKSALIKKDWHSIYSTSIISMVYSRRLQWYGINRLMTSLVEMLLRRVGCMAFVYLPIFLPALFDWSIHRQNGEVKNADGKKPRRSKRRMGKKIDGKKRRITKNFEW